MYNINIREEKFGGTLFNLTTGKRTYINKGELNNILTNLIFPSDINVPNKIKLENIKFSKLNLANSGNHYSFADIVFLEVSRKCNLRCKHCLNNSGTNMLNEMSQEELKKVVNDLALCGVQEIRFTGGEPLLYKGIYELLKLSSDKGIYTVIGTNGTLITKEVAKKLKDAGLMKAVISIDGFSKMNDFIRGEGNYDKAMHGLENLMEQGIDVRVNSVLMKSNMDDVINLAKEMHNKKIHIFLRRFIEAGRGNSLKNNMLNAEDYKYVKEALKEELKDRYVIGHYLMDASFILPRIELPFKFQGCKAGQRSIAIMADGDIQLCGFLYSQGVKAVNNVRNIKNWMDFWNDLQKNNRLNCLNEKLKQYNSIPGVQQTYCLAYIQREINKGGL